MASELMRFITQQLKCNMHIFLSVDRNGRNDSNPDQNYQIFPALSDWKHLNAANRLAHDTAAKCNSTGSVYSKLKLNSTARRAKAA